MPEEHPNESRVMNNQTESHTMTLSEPPSVLQLRASDSRPPPEIQSLPRLSSRSGRNQVRWDEGVIDNENMDKKKSKICCIFHPQQNFDDLENDECGHCSPDSDSSSSSSSSSQSNDEKNMDFESRRKMRRERRHKKLQEKRSSSPNAYEIQPDYTEYRDKHLNHAHSK